MPVKTAALCVSIFAAAGIVAAAVGWLGSTADGRFDSIELRLESMDGRLVEVITNETRNGERLDQLLRYMRGRGALPIVVVDHGSCE